VTNFYYQEIVYPLEGIQNGSWVTKTRVRRADYTRKIAPATTWDCNFIVWCGCIICHMILLEMGKLKFDRVHWLGPGRFAWKDYATNEISSCS